MNEKKYILVAGSFEYLHAGHKELLKRAFREKENVIVGLASDKFLKDKNVPFPVPLNIRKKELRMYLKRYFRRYKVIIFDDRYDQTIFRNDLVKIVVSADTYQYALEINRMRDRKNLKKVAIIKLQTVIAEDGKKISSSRIKAGEIDRKGKLYMKKEFLDKEYKMPRKTIPILKKPWGKMVRLNTIKHKLNDKYKITVGDVSTKKLIKHKIKIDLGIIDHRVKRKDLLPHEKLKDGNFKRNVKAKNPPSRITPNLLKIMYGIHKYFGKETVLVEVAGEEDLAAIPAILVAPLNTFLFYGQPNVGLVMIEVNEKVKDKARVVLRTFSS